MAETMQSLDQLSALKPAAAPETPKYVQSLELVESFDHINGGKGGYWEDLGYNWWGGI